MPEVAVIRERESAERKRVAATQALPGIVNSERKWSDALPAGHRLISSPPALRIEWAKTRTKAMRYAEEVDLLEEEMRRVLQFLDWRAEWWQSQVGLRVEKQPEEALREGHAAYAMKQAGYMKAMRARFAKNWEGVEKLLVDARAHYATMVADQEGEGEEGEDDKEGRPAATGWLSD